MSYLPLTRFDGIFVAYLGMMGLPDDRKEGSLVICEPTIVTVGKAANTASLQGLICISFGLPYGSHSHNSLGPEDLCSVVKYQYQATGYSSTQVE